MVPALHSEASELSQFVSFQRLLHANANFMVTQWKQSLLLRSSWTCFRAAEKKLTDRLQSPAFAGTMKNRKAFLFHISRF